MKITAWRGVGAGLVAALFVLGLVSEVDAQRGGVEAEGRETRRRRRWCFSACGERGRRLLPWRQRVGRDCPPVAGSGAGGAAAQGGGAQPQAAASGRQGRGQRCAVFCAAKPAKHASCGSTRPAGVASPAPGGIGPEPGPTPGDVQPEPGCPAVHGNGDAEHPIVDRHQRTEQLPGRQRVQQLLEQLGQRRRGGRLRGWGHRRRYGGRRREHATPDDRGCQGACAPASAPVAPPCDVAPIPVSGVPYYKCGATWYTAGYASQRCGLHARAAATRRY